MKVEKKTIKTRASSTMDNRTVEVPRFIPYDFIQRWETPAEKRARDSVSWYPGVEGLLSMPKVKEEMKPSNHQHLDNSETNMEDFAGMCYDMEDAIWTECYALEKSEEIDSDEAYLSNTQDAHKSQTISKDQVSLSISRFANKTTKSWVG